MLTRPKHLAHKDIVWGLVILSFLISVYFIPFSPQSVAIHWNSEGIPDAFAAPAWGMLIIPFSAFLLIALILALLEHDQHREDIRTLSKYAEVFLILLALFFYYINLVVIAWNLAFIPSFSLLLAPAVSAILWYGGSILRQQVINSKSKNSVEFKAKARGGIYLKAASLLTLFSLIFPDFAPFITAIAVTGACALSAHYSLQQSKSQSNRRLTAKKLLR